MDEESKPEEPVSVFTKSGCIHISAVKFIAGLTYERANRYLKQFGMTGGERDEVIKAVKDYYRAEHLPAVRRGRWDWLHQEIAKQHGAISHDMGMDK